MGHFDYKIFYFVPQKKLKYFDTALENFLPCHRSSKTFIPF